MRTLDASTLAGFAGLLGLFGSLMALSGGLVLMIAASVVGLFAVFLLSTAIAAVLGQARARHQSETSDHAMPERPLVPTR